MSDSKMLLGKRIRYLRRLKDLSQEELAEKAGISGKYIGEIERGKANLTVEIVEKISGAFKMEICDLFDFRHEASRKELTRDIHNLVRNADDEELKLILRILKSVLQ